jgi:hypothetical protein
MPAKGEKLRIGDIGQVTDDARVQKALKRLAADKAPQTVAQLVMWNVSAGLDWNSIGTMSKGWANAQELSLARSFVAQLDKLSENAETGVLLCEISASDDAGRAAAKALADALKDKTILGLKAELAVPAQPSGPAVACKIQIRADDATVQVATSDGAARSWAAVGKFTLPVTREKGALNMTAFADALAEGILDRMVRAQVSPGPRTKGKPTFKIKIENASPLILNGLAVLGKASESTEVPKVLAGISVAPFRSMTVPATEEMVKELGLRKGVRVIAADLSGL